MTKPKVALVTGAGGFIGYHLAKYLSEKYHYLVYGTDIKREPEFGAWGFMAGFAGTVDLRKPEDVYGLFQDVEPDEVYHLAASMGGIGFITKHLADVATDNVRIDVNMLEAAVTWKTKRFAYSSTACVYPAYAQGSSELGLEDFDEEMMRTDGLRESDAMPADPEPGYGWEKLFAEELCKYYQKDHGLEVRIARFHNVFGELGTYDGGKEKAPAALCRKVALAPDGGKIQVWGDGKATRSYVYIDDLVEGIYKLVQSDYSGAVNLGSDRMVSVDELANMIIAISGKKLTIEHVPGPQGVRTRNSNNELAIARLGWEPKISLEDGLARTYAWIKSQVVK